MSNKIPRKLKHFSLFIEAQGYAGRVEELTLPKLSRKTEEFRAGGMNGPVEIDMGLEKLEAEFTLAEYSEEVLKLWGVKNNAQIGLRFKGAIEADDGSGGVTPIEVMLRGRWRELDMGSWKGGDNASLKVSVAVSYYKYTSKGEGIIEIDLPNLVEKVNGVDRLAAHRAALA
jgi:P2 family phage contractile tail tube protein